MRINLYLDENESRNLEVLLNRYGGKAPAFLRMLIVKAYEKDFGGYKAKIARKEIEAAGPELTKEQICESAGGKVEMSNGIPTCVIPISRSMNRKIPVNLLGAGEFTLQKLKQEG